jgi:hypothetical protein
MFTFLLKVDDLLAPIQKSALKIMQRAAGTEGRNNHFHPDLCIKYME